MRKKLVGKYVTITCLLATGFSTAPVLAGWYINESDGYYKPDNYNDFGNYAPADIDEKLFNQLNEAKESEQLKTQADITPAAPISALPTPNPAPTQAPGMSQQIAQQPYYGSSNQARNQPSAAKQRYDRRMSYNNQRNNRGSNFNGPGNNNRNSFSGPWNNNNSGSNFGMPSMGGNNNGSNFSMPSMGGNNNGSNFSMPWGGNNSGSNFSMPWGGGNNGRR